MSLYKQFTLYTIFYFITLAHSSVHYEVQNSTERKVNGIYTQLPPDYQFKEQVIEEFNSYQPYHNIKHFKNTRHDFFLHLIERPNHQIVWLIVRSPTEWLPNAPTVRNKPLYGLPIGMWFIATTDTIHSVPVGWDRTRFTSDSETTITAYVKDEHHDTNNGTRSIMEHVPMVTPQSSAEPEPEPVEPDLASAESELHEPEQLNQNSDSYQTVAVISIVSVACVLLLVACYRAFACCARIHKSTNVDDGFELKIIRSAIHRVSSTERKIRESSKNNKMITDQDNLAEDGVNATTGQDGSDRFENRLQNLVKENGI